MRVGMIALCIALTTAPLAVLGLSAGAAVANIVVVPIEIISAAVSLITLLPRPSLDRDVRDLATQVAYERKLFRRRALADEGDPRPADVAFRAPRGIEESTLLVRWRRDNGLATGRLSEIASYYAGLDRGRLVILGEPGAGKTVLANQLIIDLIDGSSSYTAKGRVPVWLSLPSCDIGGPDALDATDPVTTHRRIDRWIVEQLTDRYGLRPSKARSLVKEGRVLPVLDGLDEMDPPADPEQRINRPRAAATLRAFNHADQPVVLACRLADYTRLANTSGAAVSILQDAEQIVLEPLDPIAIRTYLTYRFPGADGQIEERWQAVLDCLYSSADGVPGNSDRLVALLSRPWRLYLAITAYLDRDTDPSELIEHANSGWPDLMMGKLIAAVVAHHRMSTGERYNAQDVKRWLTTLARHLATTSPSPTDIRLADLWPVAGPRAARYIAALLCILTVAAPALIPCTGLVLMNHTLADPLLGEIAAGALVGGALAMLASLDRQPTSTRRLDLGKLRTWAGARRLIRTLGTRIFTYGPLLVLTVAMAVLPNFPGKFSLLAVLATGVLFGLWVVIAVGLTGDVHSIGRPSALRRDGLIYASVLGAASCLALGLPMGMIAAMALGPLGGVVVGCAVGTYYGLGYALSGWQPGGGGGGVWLRLSIATRIASKKGHLPADLVPFLDWAVDAGLLRLVGTAIQFRHRELQDWLYPPEPPC